MAVGSFQNIGQLFGVAETLLFGVAETPVVGLQETLSP